MKALRDVIVGAVIVLGILSAGNDEPQSPADVAWVVALVFAGLTCLVWCRELGSRRR